MTSVARVVTVAAMALMVCACDHGGAFVVDNKTDSEVVARVTGRVGNYGSSALTFSPRQDVLAIPAGSRLAVEVLGFTDSFTVGKIEILTHDCALVATFDQDAGGVAFARDGQVIEVDPGPTAHLQRDFPTTGTLAEDAERCSDPSQ